MIIDFHTHVYPEKIAARTLAALTDSASNVRAHTDGTLQGLLCSMKSSGIDRSVILPVATRKGQFDSINAYAKKINDSDAPLISFGGIHPDDDEVEQKLRFLKDSGFKGIKIHPDYTGTFIDDERYIRIISECVRLGLIVVTHAGKDPAFSVIHCPPVRGRVMLDKVSSLTGFKKPFFVFAHLGGENLGEVEHFLAGQNCYLDISCAFGCFGDFTENTDDDVVRIIRRHGVEKMLFATDSPWNEQKDYVAHFKSLKGLSDSEKDMILHGNAECLLTSFG